MKTKELSVKLVDCAIELAMYSVPGMMETDKDARAAYKSLATDLLLSKPRKSFQKLIPFKMRSLKTFNN
ncbi:MAG: hypothetical protein V4687_08125 [Bacteroidota bacterium]